MANPFSWRQLVSVQQIDGTALTNTTTATSIIPTAAQWTMPADDLYIGKVYGIRAGGRVSTLVTSPGTLTFSVRAGATTIFTSGALALNVVAKTDVTWDLWIRHHVKS